MDRTSRRIGNVTVNRDAARANFINHTAFAGSESIPIAGDASLRRYFRFSVGGERAILMDAPPEKGEDTRPFIKIAQHLIEHGLSAPKILASHPEDGFLLLEDLGDDLYARLLKNDLSQELPLYLAAADVLLELHQHPAPAGIGMYDAPVMAELGALAVTWYADEANGANSAKHTRLTSELEQALQANSSDHKVLVLRDYHAENLIWLPERSGVARVGLLDFQDALIGHPAYDLASLLEDARRDVTPECADNVIAYFCEQAKLDVTGFRRAYAVQAAQRNLRILGVFARLSLHYNKPHYVDLIPRVWDHLQQDLAHPDLKVLQEICADLLPAPTPEKLERLKAKCGTIPTR
jgi:aminoglycoside/choline kinase family phosphotransferase